MGTPLRRADRVDRRGAALSAATGLQPSLSQPKVARLQVGGYLRER